MGGAGLEGGSGEFRSFRVCHEVVNFLRKSASPEKILATLMTRGSAGGNGVPQGYRILSKVA